MAIIYQTKHFIVESHEKPFVDYEDWWHIRIRIKDEYRDEITDRTKLSPKQAIEYMRLSMAVWEAFEIVMNKFNIPVIKINYQEMWNWYAKEHWGKPFLHEHIFWRSKDAIKQPRPESVYLPDRNSWFYDWFRPLLENHIVLIREEIERIFQLEKYKEENRNLAK